MAETSTIEWTDATWNPVTGCSVVSPGCTNCYAMRLAGTRLQHHFSRADLTRPTKAGPVWTGEVRLNHDWINQPLFWKRPRRIFVCAHGDLFHESVPDYWIDAIFAVMAMAPQHTFQVLTKRAERMRKYFAGDARSRIVASIIDMAPADLAICDPNLEHWPLQNVWLGVSVEDQARADERIPHLVETPAAIRFISFEPLLGPVVPDLRGIDWAIVGGESGIGARDMDPAWAESLLRDCRTARVAFFMKQMARKAPIPFSMLLRQFPGGLPTPDNGSSRGLSS